MNVPRRTLALAAANALLVAALGWRILGPPLMPDLRVHTPEVPIEFADVFDRPMRTVDTASLSAQPVFHKTRQFVQPPDPNARSLRPPPPGYLFAGAMLLPDRPPVAYLKHAQSGQSLKVKVGEVLEGWTVSAIDAHSVALRFAEEVINIGGGEKVTGGIVAVAPRAASSMPAGGVRVLTAPSGGGGRSIALTAPSTPQGKPRTYQPPPST